MEHHQNQLILVTLSGYFGLKLSCARISARRAGEPALLLPRNGGLRPSLCPSKEATLDGPKKHMLMMEIVITRGAVLKWTRLKRNALFINAFAFYYLIFSCAI